MNCTMNRNCNCSGNTMSGCGRSCNMSGGNRPNNMSGFGCSNNATQGCGCSNNTTQSCGPSGNICGCKKAGGCGCMKTDGCDIGTEHVDHMAPGMCYVPWQKWQNIYKPENALCAGTIFQELDLAFLGRRCRK